MSDTLPKGNNMYDPLGNSEWSAMQAARNFQVAAHHVAEETGKVHPLSDTQQADAEPTKPTPRRLGRWDLTEGEA